MSDLQKAQEILVAGGYTCVLCADDQKHTSSARGVKPLVALYEAGTDVTGFSAADKVVGRATAFLYVLLGVKAVYAGVISRAALEVLQENRVEIAYGTLTDHIINRAGDGICPFETAVLGICNAEEAYRAIRDKMKEMNITL